MRDPGKRRREGRRRARAAAAGGEQRKRPRLRNTATTAGRWRETDDDLDELADGKRSKHHYMSVESFVAASRLSFVCAKLFFG